MLNLIYIVLDRLVARTRGERGEVAIEYVVLAGLMVAALIAGIGVLTGALDGWFSELSSDIGAAF